MSAWIALGVGGQPDNPAELYTIPLHALKYRYAEQSYLQQFRHKDLSKNFYLDMRYYTLR
ncbi:hypothetical protein [Candidatus Albibeggiatoa sp. nov. BB20]|uniref:hypothetical protein n=1 Tax=Candidatus Albibeggiatoa sp. nov. BB20 TaxID=3162723 RepID=UPI0033656893